MKAYVAIIAALAVTVMSVAAYREDGVKAKLLKAIDAERDQFFEMQSRYWTLAEHEKDSAAAARYNLAAETLTSIEFMRHNPLTGAINRILQGLDFDGELKQLSKFNSNLNTNIDGRIKDLYHLGTDAKDGEAFFNDVSALAKILEKGNEIISNILSEGRDAYPEQLRH